MEQKTINRLNRRTEAERFGINEDDLNKCCICREKPTIESVTHGHGDFGPRITCKDCGISVEFYYWDNGRIEEVWNKLHQEKDND